MTHSKFCFAAFFAIFAFSASAYSQTHVTQYPGDTTVVEAGQTVQVTCDGDSTDPQATTTICDCNYSGTHGQAVGKSGHGEICKAIHQYSKPFNCKTVKSPVVCDCNYSGTHGQAVGNTGHLEQCKAIHQYSKPFNCRGM